MSGPSHRRSDSLSLCNVVCKMIIEGLLFLSRVEVEDILVF
jgi:hypothetical protein